MSERASLRQAAYAQQIMLFRNPTGAAAIARPALRSPLPSGAGGPTSPCDTAPSSAEVQTEDMSALVRTLLAQRQELMAELRAARAAAGASQLAATPPSGMGSAQASHGPMHADDSAAATISVLREQLAQAHMRDAEWRAQVSGLQLQLDDAGEELERAASDFVEEGSRLRGAVDCLLQEIEADETEELAVAARSGVTGPPIERRQKKLAMIRRARARLQLEQEDDGSDSLAASFSQLAGRAGTPRPGDSLQESYAAAVASALADDNHSPRLTRHSSVRRGAHASTTASDATSAGDAAAHPPGDASANAATAPAEHVFHANNPNQLGDVLGEQAHDRTWLAVEALKEGLRREVAADLVGQLDEDTAKDSRPSLRKLVWGVFGSVAGAHKADDDIVQETHDWFCHLERDQVVCRPTLPHALPAFKSQNANKDLVRAFGSVEAGAGGNPALTARGDTSQSYLSVRGDQVRLRFHAPKCFAMIREFLGIDRAHLRRSLDECPWRRSTSPGKSDASMFFFGNYVLKSVKGAELAFLRSRFIAAYTQYTKHHRHTLLPHFMGLLTVTWLLRRDSHTFILMGNVFPTPYYIKSIYDLKGSTVGREALAGDGRHEEPARTAFGALLLKDNDLPQHLVICGPLRRALLLAQLRADTAFLQALNVVDYSLLVGLRSRVVSKGSSAYMDGMRASAQDDVDGSCFRSVDGGMLSLPIYEEHDANTIREDTYYVGLIDVLQPYNSGKKLEHFAKGLLLYDRHAISVVPPEEFADRLCKLVERLAI